MKLSDTVIKLRAFAGWKRGAAKRGALSRMAEHLRVTPGTVQRWLLGERVIYKSRIGDINAMIRANIPLTARKKKSSQTPNGYRVAPHRNFAAK